MRQEIETGVGDGRGLPADGPDWRTNAGLVLWPSFLVAALETMAFFATFDPLALSERAEILREAFAPRGLGYTFGFFFFWSLTAAASALTLFLAQTNERAAGRGRA